MENHSSYVQQLSWLVWGRTETKATQQELDLAIQDVINQNQPLFEKQTEDLTSHQLNFLRAITDGVHNAFTVQENIDRYNLNSSSNVNAVKAALTKKELIDTEGNYTYIVDPVMALWLKQYLF